MAAKPSQNNTRYEVITQEDPKTGDVIIPVPVALLQKLGWKEGDDVEINVDENGQLFLTKANK